MTLRLVGILGGTFNPIHYGHLRMAQELADNLELSEVKFIPSAQPPHKDLPKVGAEQRAEMVKLAIADNPLFTIEDCELNRTGNSYTIDTLIYLRELLGEDIAICLIMGTDAFRQLNTWHRWQKLTDYCHIILAQRPGDNSANEKLTDELETLLHDCYTENNEDLATKNAGYITMQSISKQEISSTQIRKLLNAGKTARYLMPENLIEYIQEYKLYQE